jgi:plastocyanin
MAGVCWAAIAVVGALDAADEPARIRGTIRFAGEVPAPKKITTSDGNVILHNDLIVDAKTKGLRFVAVILEDAPAQPKATRDKPVVVDQREMVFLPRVVAVQHGQAVRFDNSDMFNHSVMASSTNPSNQLNVFVSPGKPIEHRFEPQKRPVLIGCSLHSWMRAWVYVVAHPWFVLSDEMGRFEISNVPPGKYTVWLHHADTGLQERRKIELTVGKSLEISIDWAKVVSP